MMFSPANAVAGNTDLVTEILRRLPAKALLRFKSVSKEWRSLISSPFFAALHHHHHNHRLISSGVLLHRSSKSTLEFAFLDGAPHHRPNPSPLHPFPGDNSVTILHSCNGLILCSVRRGPHHRTFHVYNPTTGVSAAAPPLPPQSTDSTPWMNLVFDPSESPHYQLIRIQSLIIHKYSSAKGEWAPLSGDPNFRGPFNNNIPPLSGGVYWRGSLHWLGPTSDNTLSSSLSFNVEEGTFRPMPAVLDGGDQRRRRRQSLLESSGGKLLLVEVYGSGEIRVMEMREDYSAWEVRYDFGAIDGVVEGYPGVIGRVFEGSKVYYKFQVCCVVNGEEEVVVVVRIPGKVLGYGLKSKRVWEMRDVLPSSESASDFEWIDVFPYVETLACV